MTKSAVRALQLLELLAERGEPLSHGEISDALEVPKSSLTELLGAMITRRYIRRSGAGGERFALDVGILPLAGAILRQTDLVRLTQPVLESMMQRTGESAALAVRAADEVVVIARVTCNHPVAYALSIGQRGPLHAAAAGKALLGATSAAEREHYLAHAQLVALTPHTITDPQVLRRQLDAIADGAVAVGREELFEGVVTQALAVRDADGQPVASLSIGMPSMRVTAEKQRLVEAVLREATSEVSAALGWRPARQSKPQREPA